MHRIYWLLFTILCASVVSVPSSQRFNSRPARALRDMSKLRTLRRQLAFGASRNKHASSHAASRAHVPADRVAEIEQHASEAFLNPHHLQHKIEPLIDTAEHFIDYSAGDNSDYDQDEDAQHEHHPAHAYYEHDFDTDPAAIHIVGQSAESELYFEHDAEHGDHDESDDSEQNFDAQTSSVRAEDEAHEYEQFFEDDYEWAEHEDDLDPAAIHIVGQSAESELYIEHDAKHGDYDESDDSEQNFDAQTSSVRAVDEAHEYEQFFEDDYEWAEHEDDLDSDLDSVRLDGQSAGFEEVGERNYEEDEDFSSHPNSIGANGQSAEYGHISDSEGDFDDTVREEDALDADSIGADIVGQAVVLEEDAEEDSVLSEYDVDEEDSIDLDSDSAYSFERSIESEQLHDDENDFDEYDEDHGKSDPNSIHIESLSLASEDDSEGDYFEDAYDYAERALDSGMEHIHVIGQSTESEQVNETEYEPRRNEEYSDEDHVEHDVLDDDLASDEFEDDEEITLRGQALLLDEYESEGVEDGKDFVQDEDGWTEDELYEPLDDDKTVHYEDSSADEELFQEPLTVDGMSYDDEAPSDRNSVEDDESEFDEHFNESGIDDARHIAVEHEEQTNLDEVSQRKAMEYNYDQDIQAFESELSDLERKDRVNGQSALKEDYSTSYSFSAVHEELGSGYDEENEFDDEYDVDDEDGHDDDLVGASRVDLSANFEEDHDYSNERDDNVIYLDDDDDIVGEDHQYAEEFTMRASGHSSNNHVEEQFLYDTGNGDLDPESVHAESDAQYDYDESDDGHEDMSLHVDGFAIVKGANAHDEHDMYALDDTTSDIDENASHIFSFDDDDEEVAQEQLFDAEDFSQDDDDDDDEGRQWSTRFDSDYSDEDGLGETDGYDHQEVDTDIGIAWDDYLVDYALNRQKHDDDDDLSTASSAEYNLIDMRNSGMKDAHRAYYDIDTRYEVEDGFDITSHSHDFFHDTMKSIAI